MSQRGNLQVVRALPEDERKNSSYSDARASPNSRSCVALARPRITFGEERGLISRTAANNRAYMYKHY